MKYAIKILTVLMSLVISAAAQTQSQEVKFDGLGVKIAGTLTLPKLDAGKRAPAVLIVGGSGLTPRDGFTFGDAKHWIYRDLAETLAARGYASLRYDKRCAGASECRKAESFDDYIDDAKGALEFLRKHEKVDPRRIFLFGHGEGGVIASTLGSSDEQGLAGVTLAGSPGRNLSKLMRDWLQLRLAGEGKKPDETAVALVKYDRVVRGLTNGQTRFPNEQFDKNNMVDALLLDWIGQYDVVVSLLINDPLQIAANIKSPVLILQGRKDLQVAVKDAQYLEEALKRVNHPDTSLHLFDDADHLLKTNKGAASLASYADASRPLDAAMLTVLTDWMGKKRNDSRSEIR
ncbi:MAG: alpha/beta hydrolase family protein [Blastocatellia bacterium]